MPHFQGVFFALLAVTVGGIMLAVAAKELLTLYISIEAGQYHELYPGRLCQGRQTLF